MHQAMLLDGKRAIAVRDTIAAHRPISLSLHLDHATEEYGSDDDDEEGPSTSTYMGEDSDTEPPASDVEDDAMVVDDGILEGEGFQVYLSNEDGVPAPIMPIDDSLIDPQLFGESDVRNEGEREEDASPEEPQPVRLFQWHGPGASPLSQSWTPGCVFKEVNPALSHHTPEQQIRKIYRHRRTDAYNACAELTNQRCNAL